MFNFPSEFDRSICHELLADIEDTPVTPMQAISLIRQSVQLSEPFLSTLEVSAIQCDAQRGDRFGLAGFCMRRDEIAQEFVRKPVPENISVDLFSLKLPEGFRDFVEVLAVCPELGEDVQRKFFDLGQPAVLPTLIIQPDRLPNIGFAKFSSDRRPKTTGMMCATRTSNQVILPTRIFPLW